MNFFKNILMTLLLCTLNSASPKSLNKPQPIIPIVEQEKTIAAKKIKAQPIKSPIKQQPIIQQKTYAQALNTVRMMPSHEVLNNNIFTQQFINFVKSLSLSPIETTALLQAGANLHTTWSDDNQRNKNTLLSQKNSIATLSPSKVIQEKKPTIQKKPIVQKPTEPKNKTAKEIAPKEKNQEPKPKPTEQHTQKQLPSPAINNLIMLLDPEKVEQLGNYSRAMVQDAVIDLYEQASPIIMTSNILEIITSIRQQIGEKNLQQLKSQPYNQIIPFAQQLVKIYSPHEAPLHIILLSLINFDSKNFNCYFHKSSHLVLIIPQQYLNKNIPNAGTLNADDRVRACGFNPSALTKIDTLTTNNLTQQIKIQQTKPMGQANIIADLTSLFIPQKKDGELISPEQDTKWVIYLSGHGGPAYQSMGNLQGPLQQIARVAGLTMSNFNQLMKFFNNSINTAFLHYTTCFSGGYNQVFVNEVLSSLDANFIVSSEGLGERKTSGLSLQMSFSTQEPRIRLGHYPFTEFFALLKLFVSNPEEFVKKKEAKKDPLVVLLSTIHANMTEENQPFVRFPGIGVFGALAMNKKTKVLTQSIVKAHEIEKKSIDVSKMNIIIVRPSRINVPINLGRITNNEHRAIVSPTPTNMSQYHELIHLFAEVNCQSSIQSLLFNFVYLNTSMKTQTFVVKKVTGVSIQPNQIGTIGNLIIQINKPSIHAGNISANVSISFEYNNNIYQATIGITNFDNSNAVFNAFSKIAFTVQPEKTTNMTALANKFLTPQEVNKITRPITLHNIVDFIDNKIDQQTPSLFQQPDEDTAALQEFLKRKKNK